MTWLNGKGHLASSDVSLNPLMCTLCAPKHTKDTDIDEQSNQRVMFVRSRATTHIPILKTFQIPQYPQKICFSYKLWFSLVPPLPNSRYYMSYQIHEYLDDHQHLTMMGKHRYFKLWREDRVSQRLCDLLNIIKHMSKSRLHITIVWDPFSRRQLSKE